MHAPIRTLLWEQWQMLRGPLLYAVVYSLVCVCFPKTPGAFLIGAVFYILAFLSFIRFADKIKLDWGNFGTNSHAFQFLLPLHTYKIAAAYFFPRILVFGLSLCAMHTLYATVTIVFDFNFGLAAKDIRSTFISFVLIFSALQAILSFPKLQRAIVGASLIVVLGSQVNTLSHLLSEAAKSWYTTGLLSCFFMSVCFGMSIWGISRQRHQPGRTVRPYWILTRSHKTRCSVPKTTPSTREKALFWFEWRTYSWKIWITSFAGSFASLLIFLPYDSAYCINALHILMLVSIILSSSIWGGIMLLHCDRGQCNANALVYMALPISTSTMARARIKAGACGIISSFATALIVSMIGLSVYYIYNVHFSVYSYLPLEINPSEYLFAKSGVILISIFAVWTILWLSIFPPAIFMFVYVLLDHNVYLHLYFFPSIIICIFFLFSWLLKKKLLTFNILLKLVALWILLTILSIAISLFPDKSITFPISLFNFTFQKICSSLFFWCPFSVLPVLPFLTVPLTIERMRHR